MEHLSLLAGGQGHSRADWEKAAADVLRKANRMQPDDPDSLVWEKLSRATLDQITVAPLGTPESVAGLADPGVPGAAPYTRGATAQRPAEGWDIRAHLADPDARQAAADALTDLENGVTSLWLSLGAGGLALDDLGTVLEKVYVDLAPVVLDAPADQVAAAETFVALLEERAVEPCSGTSLGGDPVGASLRGVEVEVAATVLRLAELARQSRVTFALTVDATALHDRGASDAQELGYSLAVGAAYLRILTGQGGLDVATAASLIEFRYAATDEQFTTIAKLRAARRLWHRVLELSGVAEPAGQVQHAVTSRPMMTKYDPWVNMLRTTVAAFAAGVGGATSVTVLPFDSAIGLPDALARRNARNTSSLLIHESHLARVSDPAGGSYAVERLTDDLAQAGWAEFGRLEQAGGVVAALADGSLLARVEAVADRRRAEVARRKRPVTGVSEFPHLHEELPTRRPHPAGAWEVDGYGAEFEAMRDEPASAAVFLATLGPIAAHTARATFASNLLAAGGVDAVAAGATDDAQALVAAYREHGAPRVVCLAGTDTAYAEWGAAAVAALREAGAGYVVLAGKPGDGTVAADLVDDSCAMGLDALAFLRRVREELSK